MSDWINVANVDEVLENMPVYFEIDGMSIILIKQREQFYAIENICSHDGGELSGGCINDDVIVCPRHGATFSIKTGEALSAPAYEPITVFKVRIENRMVQVRDDRFD